MNKPSILRELSTNDAGIGIFEEPDGSILLTISHIPGANKDSTTHKIAQALINIAVTEGWSDDWLPSGDDLLPTSPPNATLH